MAKKKSLNRKKNSISKNKDRKIIFNRRLSTKVQNNKFLILAILAIILFSFGVLYGQIFNSKVDMNGDNLNYYYLAKNIKDTGKYALSYDLKQLPHRHFPPGYPWIISAAMYINQSTDFIKLVNGLFFGLSLIFIFFTIKSLNIDISTNIATCIAVLLNGHMLQYSSIMMSEISYILMSMLTLFFFVKADFKKLPHKNLYFWLGMLSLIYAYYIRSQGIALFAGAIFFLLLSRHWWYVLATVGGYLLGLLPWYLRNKSHGIKSAYVKQLLSDNPYRPEEGMVGISGLFDRFYHNLLRYLDKELPSGLFSDLPINYTSKDEWNFVFYGIIILAFSIIGVINVPKKKLLLIGYIGGTFGILLLWPSQWFGVRFILPIIPIIILLFLWGIKMSIEFLLNKLNISIPFNTLLLLPLFIMGNNEKIDKLKFDADNKAYPAKAERYIEAARWSTKNLPEKAIVSCRKPEIFHHFSGLPTSRFLNTKDEQKLMDFFSSNSITHVIIDQLGYSSTGRYLLPVVQNNPQRFRVIYKTEEPFTFVIAFN